jgi:hypothetical protein
MYIIFVSIVCWGGEAYMHDLYIIYAPSVAIVTS